MSLDQLSNMSKDDISGELLEPPAPCLKSCCKYPGKAGYFPKTYVPREGIKLKVNDDDLGDASPDHPVVVDYKGENWRAIGLTNADGQPVRRAIDAENSESGSKEKIVVLEGKRICNCGPRLVRTPGNRFQAADHWFIILEVLCVALAIGAGFGAAFHAEWEGNILWLAYVCGLEIFIVFAFVLETNRRNAWVTLTKWMHSGLTWLSIIFFFTAATAFAMVTLSDKAEACYNEYCRCEVDGAYKFGISCGIRKQDLTTLGDKLKECQGTYDQLQIGETKVVAISSLAAAEQIKLENKKDEDLRAAPVTVSYDNNNEWRAVSLLENERVDLAWGTLCHGTANSIHEARCGGLKTPKLCDEDTHCLWNEAPVQTTGICADSPCRYELYSNIKDGSCKNNTLPVLDPDELGMRYVTRAMWLISLLAFVCVLIGSWEKFKYFTAFNPIPHSLIYLIFPIWIIMTICRILVPPKDEIKEELLIQKKVDDQNRGEGSEDENFGQRKPRPSMLNVISRNNIREAGSTIRSDYTGNKIKYVPASMKDYEWSWHKYQNLSTIFSYMSLWILLTMVFMVFIGALLVAYIADVGRALTPDLTDPAQVSSGGGDYKAIVGIIVYVLIANFIGINPVAPGSFIDILGGFMLTMIVAGSYDWAKNSPFLSWLFSFTVVILIHFVSSCLQYWMGMMPAIRNWMNKVMPPALAASSDTVLQSANCIKVGIIGQLFMDTMNGLNQGRMGMNFCTQFWSEYSSLPNAIGLVTFGWILVVDSVYRDMDGLDWTSQALPLVVMVALAWQMIASAWAFKEMVSTLSSPEYGLQLVKWKACQTFIQRGYRPTTKGWEQDVFKLGYRDSRQGPLIASVKPINDTEFSTTIPIAGPEPASMIEHDHSQSLEGGTPTNVVNEEKADNFLTPAGQTKDDYFTECLWAKTKPLRDDYNRRIFWLTSNPSLGASVSGSITRSDNIKHEGDEEENVAHPTGDKRFGIEVDKEDLVGFTTNGTGPCMYKGQRRSIIDWKNNNQTAVLKFTYSMEDEFEALFDGINQAKIPIAHSLAKKSLDDKEDRAVQQHCEERIREIEDAFGEKDGKMEKLVVKNKPYEITKNIFSIMSEHLGDEEDWIDQVNVNDLEDEGGLKKIVDKDMEARFKNNVTVTYKGEKRTAIGQKGSDTYILLSKRRPACSCCGSRIFRNYVCHYMKWIDLVHFLTIAIMFGSGVSAYINLIRNKMEIQNAVECGSHVVPDIGPYAKSCQAASREDNIPKCSHFKTDGACNADQDCNWGLGGKWIQCSKPNKEFVEDAPIGWSSLIIYCVVTTLYYIMELWDYIKSTGSGIMAIVLCRCCPCCGDEEKGESEETAFTIEEDAMRAWLNEAERRGITKSPSGSPDAERDSNSEDFFANAGARTADAHSGSPVLAGGAATSDGRDKSIQSPDHTLGANGAET